MRCVTKSVESLILIWKRDVVQSVVSGLFGKSLLVQWRFPLILAESTVWICPLKWKGTVAVLANADPQDRKAVYNELNLSVTYHQDGRMKVAAGPDPCTDCVGGTTQTIPLP